MPGSPIAKAGLVAGDSSVIVNGMGYCLGGDVITAIDGVKVDSVLALRAVISEHAPGETLDPARRAPEREEQGLRGQARHAAADVARAEVRLRHARARRAGFRRARAPGVRAEREPRRRARRPTDRPPRRAGRRPVRATSPIAVRSCVTRTRAWTRRSPPVFATMSSTSPRSSGRIVQSTSSPPSTFAVVTGTRVPRGRRGDSTMRPDRRTGPSAEAAGETHSEAPAGRSEIVGNG